MKIEQAIDTESPDFYLAATDHYELAAPIKCWRIKRIRGKMCRFRLPILHPEVGRGFLLIRVEPSMRMGDKIVGEVLVSSKGLPLFPITEWPVFIFVLETSVGDLVSRDVICDHEVKVFDWAALYPTEEAAREALRKPTL
ncbi:MAG TPA: hypothetical protein VFG99_05785 [Chloroflexia bacterium]|nr:hypothetical protein [Chloroflexia bacterium]